MIEIATVTEIIEGVDSVIEDHRLQDLVMDTQMISVVTFMDEVRVFWLGQEKATMTCFLCLFVPEIYNTLTMLFVLSSCCKQAHEGTMVHQEDEEVLMENLHQIAMDHQAVDPLHRVVENVAVAMKAPLGSRYWSEMWLRL